ncbi:MAG TPA: trypsin-like peptidase domain-containing protein [Anaerolineales bacterium]|nr:trypsin-like peptidase domain-containing protein [Anaerolineales bacterium]
MDDLLEALSRDTAEVAERARESLVTVLQQGVGAGSGVLWAPGLVVTNAHVARRSRSVVTLAGGQEATARRRGRDFQHDLAVLEIDPALGSPAAIGDSGELRPGEWVYAVGNPWGVPGALTAGVVIANGGGAGTELLELDLHLRPGHSGGAVLNARGEVVGINTMMNGPDVGLAIPSAVVRRYLAQAGLGKAAFRRAA